MWFKNNLLNKYLNTEIHYIISHDWWKYTKLILIFSLILILIIALYLNIYILFNSTALKILNIIFAAIWMLIYIIFTVNFINLYLDTLVVTNSWLILFEWSWLFKYSTESIDWNSIQAIEDEQSWLFDIILNKWDLKIKRAWESYTFQDVSSCSTERNKIIEYKDKFEEKKQELKEENEQPELDKFDVLVETLWEVILDYIKKK